MSELRTQITADMKQAMKDGDKQKLATLRLVNAALKDVDISARVAGDSQIHDADVLAVLQKMLKQREESAKTYEENNRPELAAQERAEIEVIKAYMPQTLEDEDLDAAIHSAVTESGAAGPADMGKVMTVLKEKYPGQIDMGKASGKVKALLMGAK